MNEAERNHLIELGPESLADALLGLSIRNEAANELVKRMVSKPNENIDRFKKGLSYLKTTKHFFPWRESGNVADQMLGLLDDLRAAKPEPKTGIKLLVSFYKADGAIFEKSDDSSGNIGDVFRHDAKDLFVLYASKCPDKKWLADLVLDLNRDDGYGIRDALIQCAKDYLPEPVIREMIEHLWGLEAQAKDESQKRHWLSIIQMLARQVKDGPLFEKARLASWPDLSSAACLDIAAVYLECDKPSSALAWLDRVPEGETFRHDERDKLLLDTYRKLGDLGKQTEIAWRIFKRHRSEDTLSILIGIIGPENRARVVEEEARTILVSEKLSCTNAEFLIKTGRIDDAETYLLERAGQLDGDRYGSLLPLAEAMEADKRSLAATVIFRALLESILKRAMSKYYHHGVRYLEKLDELADRTPDWREITPHGAYKDNLRRVHIRKVSFWSRYTGE